MMLSESQSSRQAVPTYSFETSAIIYNQITHYNTHFALLSNSTCLPLLLQLMGLEGCPPPLHIKHFSYHMIILLFNIR